MCKADILWTPYFLYLKKNKVDGSEFIIGGSGFIFGGNWRQFSSNKDQTSIMVSLSSCVICICLDRRCFSTPVSVTG